jgi:hypothetical protein
MSRRKTGQDILISWGVVEARIESRRDYGVTHVGEGAQL